MCFYANLFGKDIKVSTGDKQPGLSSCLKTELGACTCTPQVCIPVVSVRLVKKHKTAGLVPNGLAITMDTGQKVQVRHQDAARRQQQSHKCMFLSLQYVFVSLLSRDNVYDVLRRICTHLQVRASPVRL